MRLAERKQRVPLTPRKFRELDYVAAWWMHLDGETVAE